MTHRTSSGALLAVARPAEATVATNVRPALDSTFVGRQSAIAEVQACLADGARLVTVTGTAGVGKTRLAHTIAVQCAGLRRQARFDEVWWIELRTTTDRAGLLAELALQLGVELGDGSEDATLDRLARVLTGRGRVLLVLDELDALVDDGDVLIELLERAPDTVLLTTSRVALGRSGERRVALGPLDEAADAVRLFCDRARARRPDLNLDDGHTRRAVEHIVELLDRLPLALELAAALLALYDAPSLLRRLDHGLDALRANDAGRAPRHRSLYRALSSSWTRLEPDVQHALTSCTVFAGSFDAAAAEAVIGAGVEGIDHLSTLLSSSLVQRETRDDGQTRLSLYQGVREFVRQQSDAATLAEAAHRHLVHYAGRAGEWSALLTGGYYRPEVLRAVSDERANLRTAVATAVARPDDASLANGLTCACALSFDLRRREGTRRLGELLGPVFERIAARTGVALSGSLDGPAAGFDPAALATVLSDEGRTTLCELFVLIGVTQAASARLELAGAWLQLATRLAEHLDDDVLRGRIALERGIYLRTTALDEALAATETALEHFAGQDAAAWAARARVNIALIHHTRGDLAAAERVYLPALREATALSLELLAAFIGAQLSSIAWQHGEIEVARRRLSAALEVQIRADEQRQEATSRAGLAIFALDLGDLDEARHHNARALELHARFGHTLPLAISHMHRVWIEALAGDLVVAEEHLLRLRTLLQPDTNLRHAVWFARAAVVVAAARGDLPQALRRLEPLLDRLATMPPRDRAELHFTALALGGLLRQPALADAHHRALASLERGALNHACRAMVALAPAFVALAHADDEELDPDAARDVVTAFASVFAEDGDQASVHDCFQVRFWLDQLERALPDTTRVAAWAEALDPQRAAVVIEPTRELVRLPGGELGDLGRRRTVAAVLWALIHHARTAPTDAVLDHDALLEAGWPGEQMLPEAALNRLHKTLSMVRKLGLRDHLELVDDGYRLSPALPIVTVPAAFDTWWDAHQRDAQTPTTTTLRAVEPDAWQKV